MVFRLDGAGLGAARFLAGLGRMARAPGMQKGDHSSLGALFFVLLAGQAGLSESHSTTKYAFYRRIWNPGSFLHGFHIIITFKSGIFLEET